MCVESQCVCVGSLSVHVWGISVCMREGAHMRVHALCEHEAVYFPKWFRVKNEVACTHPRAFLLLKTANRQN